VSENLPNAVLEALAMSSTPHMVPEGAEVEREAVQLPAVRVGTAEMAPEVLKVQQEGMEVRHQGVTARVVPVAPVARAVILVAVEEAGGVVMPAPS